MAYYKCGKIFATQNSNTSIETASGAIANFRTSLAMPVLGCNVEFSASQADGTPTPASPIPIIGVDKVNVVCCGKNLFSSTFIVGSRANTTTGVFEPYSDGARTDYIEIKPNLTYTFSGFYNGFSSYFSYYDKDKNYISRSASTPRTTATETPPVNAYFVVVSYVKITGQTGDISTVLDYDYQLEFGSTATTYEPYNGTTALINLGGTYYGGSVDEVTGKITVNKGYRVFTGSETWTWNSSNEFWYVGGFSNMTGNSTQTSNGIVTRPTGTTARVYSRDNSGIDGNTNMNDIFPNGTQVVYELETPIVVYASNTAEILTKAGLNNIFCDTGDIEVKYRKLHSDN